MTDFKKLKTLMDKNAALYENPDFIPADPISVPHKFSKKEDIEIAGFFVSIFAWGNRTAILKSADKLMALMQNEPYSFLMNATPSQLKTLTSFYHRTLNGEDSFAIAKAIKSVYLKKGGFENLFAPQNLQEPLIVRMSRFRSELIRGMPERTVKHIGNMEGGSAAKRLNMFLRWMVRSSEAGVDFGLWKSIKPSELYLPLDVHCARRGRELGLLTRKQNDRKAVEEITGRLREFCPEDPVKYDFALFAPSVEGEK
ncbi:TIGR02757 family protein [Treponema pedis]|uniref:TIGR02757 family protein n=1 Tax=Treponema pedis TaxID=409322 RepID=A0A7S7AX11_9SPIR|nr:TIGR02757 family protein [Treponema pedis]QOW60646.1 TIGR02757 family protein [Treponema pedis]